MSDRSPLWGGPRAGGWWQHGTAKHFCSTCSRQYHHYQLISCAFVLFYNRLFKFSQDNNEAITGLRVTVCALWAGLSWAEPPTYNSEACLCQTSHSFPHRQSRPPAWGWKHMKVFCWQRWYFKNFRRFIPSVKAGFTSTKTFNKNFE